MSTASGFGTTWLKNAFMAICHAMATTKPAVTARKRPQTYSPAVSGVEWRMASTFSSRSRSSVRPAPTEMKKP